MDAGEVLVFVLAAGFMFSLPIAIIAFAVLRPKYWGLEWARSAAALGMQLLPYDPAQHRTGFPAWVPSFKQPMRGQRAGLDIECGVRVVVSGSGKNRSVHYYTYARAYYGRNLGMGLDLCSLGLVNRFWQKVAGQVDIQCGDPRIDPRYDIRGVDEEHVRALVRTPYVADALAAAADWPHRVYIGDSELRVEIDQRMLDAPGLARSIDGAVDLARRVLAARDTVGPSRAERAIHDAMGAVAARRGVHYDPSATCLSGRVEGVHVEVSAFVRQQQRWTRFTARFDRALGANLALTRQGNPGLLSSLFTGQDIQTGDPVFDARFVVKGSPEASVRAILTPDVRSRLAHLQDLATTLVVRDDRVEAELAWVVYDPEQIERGMLALAHAGAAMSQITTAAAGPFRR